MYNGDTRLSHAPTLHRKPHMRCVSREIYRYIRPGAAPSRNPHSQRCSVEALLSYPQLLHAPNHTTRRAQWQTIRPFVNLWQVVSFEKRPWRHHRHISCVMICASLLCPSAIHNPEGATANKYEIKRSRMPGFCNGRKRGSAPTTELPLTEAGGVGSVTRA